VMELLQMQSVLVQVHVVNGVVDAVRGDRC